MYCTKCGAKLTDQARFCTACGSPVAEAVQDAQNNIDNNLDASRPKYVAPTKPSAADDTNRPVVEAGAADDSSAAAAEQTSFKAALDSSKKKSKRRIPIVVLVALVTLLVSSIAYAAYRVYTDIIAPQIEQTQQTEAQEQPQVVEPSTSTNDEAHQAYQSVLNEYAEFETNPPEDYRWGLNDGGVDSYQYCYVADYYPGASYSYAYVDIDQDSVDELFIGLDYGSSNDESNGNSETSNSYSNVFICAFDYHDGSITRFCEGWVRNSYHFGENNVILQYGSGGYDSGTDSAYTWNGTELVTIESIGWTYQDPNNRENAYIVTQEYNGETSETVGPFDSVVEKAIETFELKYPELSGEMLEWHSFSNL